ncbi:MAG: hypothetical protein ACREPX_01010 [Rhodanobacteraceae bacterium]
MSLVKHIAVIGVSDEETAHLRLLIRRAAEDLSHTWKWGSESGADLVIVDPASFAGQMARTRVQAAGLRCAVFTDEPSTGPELVLRRPLKLVNVVAVLNQAADSVEGPSGIVMQKQDFYFHDVADDTGDATDLPEPILASPPPPDAAPGLEELLRIDPVDIKEATRVNVKLAEDTTVFGTSGPTRRSEVRGREGRDLFAKQRNEGPVTAAPVRATSATELARHSLRVYLDSGILGGPARIVLPDAPPLVLDPKQKMFHASARLIALEPYCRTALRHGVWLPLTTAELAELRVSEPPQPYLRLIWLYTLIHSEGQLARHLDPGGTYRLVRWIEIERDFSAYFRIASTLLTPARLHEIAAASGATMAGVFDVVNAYDAIGLIDCQPRPPRNPVPAEPAPSGLLQRLKRPFRK